MKKLRNLSLIVVLCILSVGSVLKCTHKENINPVIPPTTITRGEDRLTNFDPANPNNTSKDITKCKMDKTHGNVGWSTQYLFLFCVNLVTRYLL